MFWSFSIAIVWKGLSLIWLVTLQLGKATKWGSSPKKKNYTNYMFKSFQSVRGLKKIQQNEIL